MTLHYNITDVTMWWFVATQHCDTPWQHV